MISGESQHQTVAESSHGRLRSQHADRDSMTGAGSISRKVVRCYHCGIRRDFLKAGSVCEKSYFKAHGFWAK